jgi:hypothetical protein
VACRPTLKDPNISVDPSLGPPAISFAGGLTVRAAPANDHLTAHIEDDAAGIYRVRDMTVMKWTREPVDGGEPPPGHHGRPPMVQVLEIVSTIGGDSPIDIRAG